MILDDKFEMPIATPARVSHSGDFAVVDTFAFSPPQPKMAREVSKMNRYFTKVQKEVSAFLASTAPKQMAEHVGQAVEGLTAGTAVEAIHEEYKDGDPIAKEAKLKEIETSIDALTQAMDMCSEVDFYQMTVDFGKMISTHRLCRLKGKDGGGQEITLDVTIALWENNIDYRDRLAAVVRYCCFFDLTSSLQS